jgi:hypothetical protein
MEMNQKSGHMLKYVGKKSDHIAFVDDLITKECCDEVVQECMKNYGQFFSSGPTIGGYNPNIKSSMDFHFYPETYESLGIYSPSLTKNYFAIQDAMASAISLYVEQFPVLQQSPVLWDTGFRLQHYVKNKGFYRIHHDGSPWAGSQIDKRVLGVIIYLNTIEKGGGTAFIDHELSINAVCGRIAVFPASWTHQHAGLVPISGDKWIISSFVQCNEQAESQSSGITEITPQQVSNDELDNILNVRI